VSLLYSRQRIMQAVIERITPEKYVLFYQNGIDLSSKELQFCISIQPEGERQRHAIKKISSAP